VVVNDSNPKTTFLHTTSQLLLISLYTPNSKLKLNKIAFQIYKYDFIIESEHDVNKIQGQQ